MNALETVRASLARVNGEIRAMEDLATKENRSQYASEARKVAKLNDEIATLEARESELAEQESRAQQERDSMRKVGGATVNDAPVYRADGEFSFYRDMFAAKQGDARAAERLGRNQQQRSATGVTSTVAGAFDPPAYLVDQYVKYARAGRVFADSLTREPLPTGVSSISVPTIATGTTTGIQTADLTTLSNTDLTTSVITHGISTIGGLQIVSLQALEQSPIPFDQAVTQDLAMSYAQQLDAQTFSGTDASGQLSGILHQISANTVTITKGTGAVSAGAFLGSIGHAISNLSSNRFLSPDRILMHPRRFAWLSQLVDDQHRPLVVPSGSGPMNTVAVFDQVTAEGQAGSIFGLPVLLDANVPTNLGAGTNEDTVLVYRSGDLVAYESPLQVASFASPYADQAGVLYRVMAYNSGVFVRHTSAVERIGGTALASSNLSWTVDA